MGTEGKGQPIDRGLYRGIAMAAAQEVRRGFKGLRRAGGGLVERAGERWCGLRWAAQAQRG